MLTMQRLEALVQERLGGDNARLLELFDTRDVFEMLRAGAPDSDWYHFEPKTFDGRYLIETESGFRTYQQDRGAKEGIRDFASLREAAQLLFG